MDRLYIISKSEESGSADACMKLYLSTGSFRVITSPEGLSIVPNGAIVTHGSEHPDDSVAMRDTLRGRGCIVFKNLDDLVGMVQGIGGEIISTNQLYMEMTGTAAIEAGARRIMDMLRSCHLTQENGFQYRVLRDPRSRTFVILPDSPKMRVIVNLVTGYLMTLSNQYRENVKQ